LAAAVLGFLDGAIVDLKVMRDAGAVWSEVENCRLPFVEAWGYDIQGAVYQAVEGNMLPFVLAVATKEAVPDLLALTIAQPDLDARLAMVEDLAPRYQAIKEGREEARRCEHCDYCKSTKCLTTIMDYREVSASW